MKDSDKITMTVGQLKRLIKESDSWADYTLYGPETNKYSKNLRPFLLKYKNSSNSCLGNIMYGDYGEIKLYPKPNCTVGMLYKDFYRFYEENYEYGYLIMTPFAKYLKIRIPTNI